MDLQTLTLEQKVGQLFLLGYSNLNPSGDLINLLTKYHVGGIVYTGQHQQSPKRIYQFTNSIQKYASKQMPLFISINEDNINLIEEMIHLPNKLALGAIDNRLYSKKIAEAVAQQLKNLGVNMILSPNLNIYKNESNQQYTLFPFGENVTKVKKHGTDMIQGYQNKHVIPVMNRFPTIETDEQIHPLSEHSLQPFMYAIQQNVDTLMISHVEGASLSAEMIQEGIREAIGYDGIVMTDSIEKLTINNECNLQEAALLALKAGADIININESLENQQSTIDSIIRAVKSGELSEERINQSVERILRVKNKYQLSELPTFDPELIGNGQHIEFTKKLSEQAVTVVKHDQPMIPLNKKQETIILIPSTNDEATKGNTMTSELLQSFNDFFHGELENFTSLSLDNKQDCLKACEKAEQIIIPLNELSENKQLSQTTKQVLQTYHDKTIVCSFGNLYDLHEVQNAATILLTYELSLMSMQSMAKVILNKSRTRGKLPLTLSDQWQLGHQA